MGSIGDAFDNAMAESFFATLKEEMIYRRAWPTAAAGVASPDPDLRHAADLLQHALDDLAALLGARFPGLRSTTAEVLAAHAPGHAATRA